MKINGVSLSKITDEVLLTKLVTIKQSLLFTFKLYELILYIREDNNNIKSSDQSLLVRADTTLVSRLGVLIER